MRPVARVDARSFGERANSELMKKNHRRNWMRISRERRSELFPQINDVSRRDYLRNLRSLFFFFNSRHNILLHTITYYRFHLLSHRRILSTARNSRRSATRIAGTDRVLSTEYYSIPR